MDVRENLSTGKRLIDANRALEIVYEQGIAHPYAYQLTNYATLILQEAPDVDVVEVIKRSEEIEKAISVLNVYRNTYYKEPSGTVEYAVADAINTILPLFAKCLEKEK